MATAYVIYNTKAGIGNALESVKKLKVTNGDNIKYTDVIDISDYREFLKELKEDDYIILAGGDGTLNRFVNNIDGIDFNMFSEKDVVRHPLVQKIIKAYEKHEYHKEVVQNEKKKFYLNRR